MIYSSIDIGSDTIKIVVAENLNNHINNQTNIKKRSTLWKTFNTAIQIRRNTDKNKTAYHTETK